MTNEELEIVRRVALWGGVGDEDLSTDLDDVLSDLPFTPEEEVVEFEGWSALPPGDSGGDTVMSGRDIALMVADRFADVCGFEVLAEQYLDAAEDPDVVAAFEAARELLVSKQSFLVAGRKIAVARVRFAFPDGGDYSYTIESVEEVE